MIEGRAAWFGMESMNGGLLVKGCFRRIGNVSVDTNHNGKVIASTKRGTLVCGQDSEGVWFKMAGRLPENFTGVSIELTVFESVRRGGVEFILDARLDRISLVTEPYTPALPKTRMAVREIKKGKQ